MIKEIGKDNLIEKIMSEVTSSKTIDNYLIAKDGAVYTTTNSEYRKIYDDDSSEFKPLTAILNMGDTEVIRRIIKDVLQENNLI